MVILKLCQFSKYEIKDLTEMYFDKDKDLEKRK